MHADIYRLRVSFTKLKQPLLKVYGKDFNEISGLMKKVRMQFGFMTYGT
jgi:hypothetical protein